MSDSGRVFVCEGCHRVIDDDVDGPKVVRLQRFSPFGHDPVQWLGETPQYFHKKHAPHLGQEWRVPEE